MPQVPRQDATDGAVADIIGWDIVNWSRALRFWDAQLNFDGKSASCLELGCGAEGGLSLWLALRGNRVLCSDFGGVRETVRRAHERYGISGLVEYADIDARRMTFAEQFDVVAFKSMLGGICPDVPSAERIVRSAYEALRPGGVLLLAENLESTALHAYLRKRFAAGAKGWRYFTRRELESTLAQFGSFESKTFGCLGCFGRTETQRRMLGRLDERVVDRIVPSTWHYIAAIVARK
ncbi:MAG TPA: class I SAM-dependent methyltransferase [Candidatus Cybelea sp.]|nr:class I SAM-dependent methyltransferase [Candidatus Cybelea sp.]